MKYPKPIQKSSDVPLNKHLGRMKIMKELKKVISIVLVIAIVGIVALRASTVSAASPGTTKSPVLSEIATGEALPLYRPALDASISIGAALAIGAAVGLAVALVTEVLHHHFTRGLRAGEPKLDVSDRLFDY
jgi:hypothetical protein